MIERAHAEDIEAALGVAHAQQIRGGLGAGVGRARAQRRGFAEGRRARRRRAVGVARAHEQHARLRRVLRHGLEQRVRAEKVDVEGERGILARRGDGADGREVDDRIRTGARDEGREHGRVRDVELAIRSDDVVSERTQVRHQVTPHESCCSGDERAHGPQAARPQSRVL